MNSKKISNKYEIDEDIRGLVEFCNNNGIKTLASCSGTLRDHKVLDGRGQLYIKDSELSRKIAAAIIERGLCTTDIHSKPAEDRKLYDNIISYHSINFNFENSYNDVLPNIEEIIRKVVSREIEPSEETMEKINQVLNFFDSIDRKINSAYTVNRPDFSGELTFHTDNISSRKRVDKESVVESLVKETGTRKINYPYYIGIIVEGNQDLQEILSKATVVIKKAPNISIRRERSMDKARQKADWENSISNVEPSQMICKTSQSLEELLGYQTNTPDEIAITDSIVEDKSSDARSDVIVEPWDNL